MSRTIIGLLCIVAAALIPRSSWAAEGWYLLIPPVSDYNERAQYLSGFSILDSQPLAEWTQQGAYDSAAECESTKQALLMMEDKFHSEVSVNYIKAIGTKDEAILKHMRYTAERSNANIGAITAARCIKTDDPRLAK